jgi:hypothetical protein
MPAPPDRKTRPGHTHRKPILIDLLTDANRAKLDEVSAHHGLGRAALVRMLVAKEFDEIRRIPE